MRSQKKREGESSLRRKVWAHSWLKQSHNQAKRCYSHSFTSSKRKKRREPEPKKEFKHSILWNYKPWLNEMLMRFMLVILFFWLPVKVFLFLSSFHWFSRSLNAHWPTNRLCHAVTATQKNSFRNANFYVIFCIERAHTQKPSQKNAQKFYQIATRGRKIKTK